MQIGSLLYAAYRGFAWTEVAWFNGDNASNFEYNDERIYLALPNARFYGLTVQKFSDSFYISNLATLSLSACVAQVYDYK